MHWRDSHTLILWWRWSRSVWGASWARVVLGTSPGQADTRVTDWVALHLVDGHLRSVALDELNETTALSWWDLDVGDLAKALEKRAQLILSDVAGKTSNKDGGVVWVGELVHWLRSTIVAHWWGAHGVHARSHVSSHAAAWHATAHSANWAAAARLVLWGSGGDTHWAVAAVDALHLGKSALLVALIGEANKSVAAGHAGDWVGHNLGRLARWEARLEEGDENVLVDLWAEIANKDGELWATVITVIISNLNEMMVV